MNDVARVQTDQNRRVNRNVNLIRGHDLMARHQRVGVFHFPPPLMAGHFDFDLRRIAGREPTDIATGGDARHQQGQKSDRADDERCPDRGTEALFSPCRHVGEGVAPSANHRCEKEGEDRDVEGCADPEENPPQIREMRGLRPGWIERRLHAAHHHFLGSSARFGIMASGRGDCATLDSKPPNART